MGAGIHFDNRLLATRVANNTTTQYRVVEVLEGWWYYMRGGLELSVEGLRAERLFVV